MYLQKSILTDYINKNTKKKIFTKKELIEIKKKTYFRKENIIDRNEVIFFLNHYKKKYNLISENIIIVENIKNYLKSLKNLKNIFLLTDKNSFIFFKKIYDVIKFKNIKYIENIKSGSDLKKYIKIIKSQKSTNLKKIVCIGGGKVFDLGKFICLKNNIPLISIPTSLATHVYCSPKIHVLKQIEDLGFKTTIDGKSSNLSIVDLKIIRKLQHSSKRLLHAGFGDLMAMINASDDWFIYINKKNNRFKIYCIQEIIKILNKIKIKKNIKYWISDYIFAQCLLCNITDWAGSAPASGSEHFFANLYEKKFKSRALHGELVALGTLIFQKFRGKKISNVLKLMKKFYISRSISELKISKKSILITLVNCKKEGVRKKRKSILDLHSLNMCEWENFLNSLFKKKILCK